MLPSDDYTAKRTCVGLEQFFNLMLNGILENTNTEETFKGGSCSQYFSSSLPKLSVIKDYPGWTFHNPENYDLFFEKVEECFHKLCIESNGLIEDVKIKAITFDSFLKFGYSHFPKTELEDVTKFLFNEFLDLDGPKLCVIVSPELWSVGSEVILDDRDENIKEEKQHEESNEVFPKQLTWLYHSLEFLKHGLMEDSCSASSAIVLMGELSNLFDNLFDLEISVNFFDKAELGKTLRNCIPFERLHCVYTWGIMHDEVIDPHIFTKFDSVFSRSSLFSAWNSYTRDITSDEISRMYNSFSIVADLKHGGNMLKSPQIKSNRDLFTDFSNNTPSGFINSISIYKPVIKLPLLVSPSDFIFSHCFVVVSGPSGSGKSLLTNLSAQAPTATGFFLEAQHLISGIYGKSQELLTQIFDKAATFPRAIIAIDDIEIIFGLKNIRFSFLDSILAHFVSLLDQCDRKKLTIVVSCQCDPMELPIELKIRVDCFLRLGKE